MKCSLGTSNFLEEFLVFPILLFSSNSLHWSLRKAFLSLLDILWNSAFQWVYLSFSPLPFSSLLFSAICKASSDNHFANQTGDGKSEHSILGVSELKWTGMGEFNSDDHYIYYCGQESLRRNRVALIVNQRVQNAVVLGCNLKSDIMISVCFQGKPFNVTVIPVYAPTRNAEKTKVE